MANNCTETLDKLDDFKIKLEKYGNLYAKEISKSTFFNSYITANYNRYLNLLDAYILLAKKDNYISAIALMRLSLDSLLRLYAITLFDDNIDNICEEILSGKQIDKFIDSNLIHKKVWLKDSYLVTKISSIERFEWISECYKNANGFIHFSDKILKSSNVSDITTNTVTHKIEIGSSFILEIDKQSSCKLMLKITDGFFELINKMQKESHTSNLFKKCNTYLT